MFVTLTCVLVSWQNITGTILYHTTLHTHTGRTFCFLRPIYNMMTTKLSLIFAPPAKFAVSVAKLTINSHSVY